MEFFHKKTNFPFMATRKVWYTLSAILMIASFASFFVKGLNFAIDFTGGVSIEATFTKEAPLEKVRTAVEAAGYHEPQVQTFGSVRDIAIRPAAHRRKRGTAAAEIREAAGGHRSGREDLQARSGRPAGG